MRTAEQDVYKMEILYPNTGNGHLLDFYSQRLLYEEKEGKRGGAKYHLPPSEEAVVNLRRASRAINECDTQYVTQSRGRSPKTPPSIFRFFRRLS